MTGRNYFKLFCFRQSHGTKIQVNNCKTKAAHKQIGLLSSPRRLGAATSNLCTRRSFAKARELKATKLRVQQIRRRGKDACLLARYYRTPGT